jgi:hypothetical protein
MMPGGFMFLIMPWVVETPRALIMRGKRVLGLKNLLILGALPAEHPYV